MNGRWIAGVLLAAQLTACGPRPGERAGPNDVDIEGCRALVAFANKASGGDGRQEEWTSTESVRVVTTIANSVVERGRDAELERAARGVLEVDAPGEMAKAAAAMGARCLELAGQG